MSQAPSNARSGAMIDPHDEVRIIVSIPGRYTLVDRRDADGNNREFACRAVNISTRQVALAAPVIGSLGVKVIAHIERIGELQGSIGRVLDRGFVMDIVATEKERSALAHKLTWVEQHKNHDVQERRRHERMVPRNPHSTLLLPDGSTLRCLVINMSASGAAVSADIVPHIGMPLAVGKVVCRVNRRFAEGFSVQFVDVQDPETLEDRLILP